MITYCSRISRDSISLFDVLVIVIAVVKMMMMMMMMMHSVDE